MKSMDPGYARRLLTLLYRDSQDCRLPHNVVDAGIRWYWEAFVNQPCPHFANAHAQVDLSVGKIPDIVLYPTLATSLRAFEHSYFGSKDERLHAARRLSEQAWSLLIQAYSLFNFDEAFFEGLCALARYDFAST